jgi:hypothetical protein
MAGRVPYTIAAEAIGLGELLKGLPWSFAGTPPLGIDIPGSDIDVICSVSDLGAFAQRIWGSCSERAGFRMWQWADGDKNVVATFEAKGWRFELFATLHPLATQVAVRHVEIEARLLIRGGKQFKTAVQAARLGGLKTEPAFAAVLGLEGNPYQALLDLHSMKDEQLNDLFSRVGFGSSGGNDE